MTVHTDNEGDVFYLVEAVLWRTEVTDTISNYIVCILKDRRQVH